MIYKNYFKTSLRMLRKNPMSSFINIFGLSVAIGFCILVYAYAKWTYGTDDFHQKCETIYLTTYFADTDGTSQQFGTTPRVLGEMLKQDFTGIQKVCRVEDKNVVAKYEDKVFHEKARLVDPEFLQMFTFPLKWGNAKSLSGLNNIILSEDMSIKYFGDTNPVGKEFQIIFAEDNSKLFTITGVAKDFPNARSFAFDFLINFENYRSTKADKNVREWSDFINATLIQVENPEYVRQINAGMDKYVRLQNQSQEDWKIADFAFEPISTLYEKSDNIRNSFSRRGFSNNEKSIYFLLAVGVVMLALACINYINIAIVSAAKRFKEIGVRKTVGATNGKVIVQFLMENMLLTCFALAFGVVLGTFAIVPWFESLNAFRMDLSLLTPSFWMFLIALLIFTGLASGIYPAYFVSKFQTASIFKGTTQIGKQNPVTKIFLGIQLVLACIAIAMAVMFTNNSDYLAKRPWGYQQEHVLFVNVHSGAAYEQLSSAIESQPDVVSVTGSREHLGKSHKVTIVEFPDRKYEVHELGVDPEYFKTMGLELVTGRFFNLFEGSDKNAIIVNETFAKNMVWDQPIGQQFQIDSVRYDVVGVVRDFHNYSFFNAVQPTIFTVASKEDYRYLSVKVEAGKETESLRNLQAQWAKLYPEIPFQGGRQEDVWGFYFQFISVHGKVWRVIASITVLLASLGLYGLVVLNVSGRVKEFSIRKILGADLQNIIRLLLKQYLLLFIISLSFGAPISYFLVKMIFDFAYKYHMPVNLTGTLIGCALLIVVLLLVVITQVRRVAKDNPVAGLKTE